MRTNVQQAQESRASGRGGPSLTLGGSAKTADSPCARLENPLGILADRSVEARMGALAEQQGHAVSYQAPDEPEQLAKGAQENGLQHPCACSARSLSPFVAVFGSGKVVQR